MQHYVIYAILDYMRVWVGFFLISNFAKAVVCTTNILRLSNACWCFNARSVYTGAPNVPSLSEKPRHPIHYSLIRVSIPLGGGGNFNSHFHMHLIPFHISFHLTFHSLFFIYENTYSLSLETNLVCLTQGRVSRPFCYSASRTDACLTAADWTVFRGAKHLNVVFYRVY